MVNIFSKLLVKARYRVCCQQLIVKTNKKLKSFYEQNNSSCIKLSYPITYHFHLSGTVFCAAVSHTYSCKFSFYLSEGLVPKVLEVGHHHI